MKTIIGKIFLISIINLSLWAQVSVSVNSDTVYPNEIVQYTITSDQENVVFPQLYDIAGYSVRGQASSKNIKVINGNVQIISSKTYSFAPSASCVIPPVEVKEGSKIVQTKPISISVQKPEPSSGGDDFVLEMIADKSDVYVGEEINLKMVFKQKLTAQASQIKLETPKMDSFWVKKDDTIKRSRAGGYALQTLTFHLTPQKGGNYTIPAFAMQIGKSQNRQRSNDPFFDDVFDVGLFETLSYSKIYSNELNITVRDLPNGVNIYGKYSISSQVDKHKVDANKPVNMILTIKGEGNIEDIQKFEIDIPNAVVYADEPTIKDTLFTQKIAIIADSNFTVPAVELVYFDKISKTLQSIQTTPIDVEVVGGARKLVSVPSTVELSPKTEAKIKANKQKTHTPEPKTIIQKESSYIKYLFLILGILIGVMLSWLLYWLISRKPKPKNNIIKAILKASSDKELFNLLLPYSKKDIAISKVLKKLEENIYKNATNKIDKEEVLEVFER